jgi:hypothetical protein
MEIDYDTYTLMCILYVGKGDQDEWLAFVSMCKARKLDPLAEARRAIQARYDAMLAE